MSIFQAQVAEHKCPYCGSINDGISIADKVTVPRVGDVSICWYCAQIAVFDTVDGVFTVRVPTFGEAMAFAADVEIQLLQASIRTSRPKGMT